MVVVLGEMQLKHRAFGAAVLQGVNRIEAVSGFFEAVAGIVIAVGGRQRGGFRILGINV